MNKLLMAAMAALFSIGPTAAQAQAIKIGFVDIEQTLREANPGKAAQTRLETEFSKRARELQDLESRLRVTADKLEKDAPALSEIERDRRSREAADQKRDFDRKNRGFQEDLNQRRSEEIAALNERVNRVVKMIFDSDKYDLILRENVAFSSDSVNITKRVINALNAQK